MRAVLPLQVIASAAIALVACNSTSPLEPLPSDHLGVTVLTVAPSFATIGGERFVKLSAILSGSATPGSSSTEVTWTSSDTSIATVGAGGLVAARKAGRVQIAATWKAAHGSATIIVLNQVGKKPASPNSPKCLARAADHRQLAIPTDGRGC